MNIRLKQLIILSGLLLCSSSSWSFFNNCCPEPYLGVDAQLRHMKWSSTNGNNVFNRNYSQGNLYIGLKINDFLGGELGYETAFRRKENVTLNTGDVFLGQTVLAEDGPPLFINSKVEMRGFHANLMGFCPIFSDGLELIGSIGLVNLKLKHKIIFFEPDGTTVIPNSLRTFEKQRLVPRFGLGLRQRLSECVGIRFMVNWEKLSRFQNIPPYATESLISPLRVNAKNSFIYSIGFFVNY
jgi:hypothetical protein